jgi:hypothetical protein
MRCVLDGEYGYKILDDLSQDLAMLLSKMPRQIKLKGDRKIQT